MAGLESYKHKAAKAVVLGWLREAAADVGYDRGAAAVGLSWRVNRHGPHWGIWPEYPVARDPDGHLIGDSPVWDETDWWVDLPGFVCRCEPFVLCECGPGRPPTYDELVALRYRPQVIFDIAVQHKGALLYGIEIVHTSAPSAAKIEALQGLACDTYVVSAEWVLRQVGRPRRLAVVDAYGAAASLDCDRLRGRVA